MIKGIEIRLAVKFIRRENRMFQHFICEKKSDFKILQDPRFLIHDKYEMKLKELSLSNDSSFKYLDRKDEDDRTVLIFEVSKDVINKFDNYYLVLPGFMPEKAGCTFCRHRVKNEREGVFCEMKQKQIVQELKKCSVFRQKEGLFKT